MGQFLNDSLCGALKIALQLDLANEDTCACNVRVSRAHVKTCVSIVYLWRL